MDCLATCSFFPFKLFYCCTKVLYLVAAAVANLQRRFGARLDLKRVSPYLLLLSIFGLFLDPPHAMQAFPKLGVLLNSFRRC